MTQKNKTEHFKRKWQQEKIWKARYMRSARKADLAFVIGMMAGYAISWIIIYNCYI